MEGELLFDGARLCVPDYCCLVQAASEQEVPFFVPFQGKYGTSMPDQRLPTHTYIRAEKVD